jgi:hypothetical protein
MGKIYVLYHASSKNSRELHECSKLLEIHLLKNGRILRTHCMALSFHLVSAVWEHLKLLFDTSKKQKMIPQKIQTDISMKKLSLLVEKCHFSTTNSSWTDPGVNPSLNSENPETNCLSHCTAIMNTITNPKQLVRIPKS